MNESTPQGKMEERPPHGTTVSTRLDPLGQVVPRRDLPAENAASLQEALRTIQRITDQVGDGLSRLAAILDRLHLLVEPAGADVLLRRRRQWRDAIVRAALSVGGEE